MEFPDEFQHQCISLIQKLITFDGARFMILDPHMHKKGLVGFNVDMQMEKTYYGGLENLDPMHLSRFEDDKETVISSNTIMDHKAWVKSLYYLEFFKPYGYLHVAEIFFRQNKKIIANLTLLRNDGTSEFTTQELDLLRNIQPFLEYSLNTIYIPARVSERQYVSDTYGLTSRELDVLEYALTGADNKTMAKKLSVSLPTLRTHLQHIYTKVDVHSTSELISKILRELNH